MAPARLSFSVIRMQRCGNSRATSSGRVCAHRGRIELLGEYFMAIEAYRTQD